MSSKVEKAALAASAFQELYPPFEKIKTIVVDNFPALGRLAAFRFLEWVQDNPEGVMSLPTGKTPEHFIKWVNRLLRTWDAPSTRPLIEAGGLDPARRPDMSGLRFVQIDEFYPIQSWQQNSFHYYVSRFYIEGFGLDPKRALLMDASRIGMSAGWDVDTLWREGEVDLSLRCRVAQNAIERRQKEALASIDQWCQEYEERVRAMGGLGFFLGGIGPDGHIGFNCRGSSHYSTTRLDDINFETQAAAATDLGGIEVSRKRKVITIGLGTITYNPQCVALIIAAGEAKAGVVANAIQQPKNTLYPGTALQSLPNARFYLTTGAAHMLIQRQVAAVAAAPAATDEQVERALVDLSVARKKRLLDLTSADAAGAPLIEAVLRKRPEPVEELARRVRESLVERIERGSKSRTGTRFLHTEPHHDDVMLGYLPHIVRHSRDTSNVHYFCTLTSGFTAVTNRFFGRQLEILRQFLASPDFADMAASGYFDPGNVEASNRDVWQYLDGVAANRPLVRHEGTARRLLRDLIEVFDEHDLGQIKDRISEMEHYLATQYPGKKDPDHLQRLKGMRREWEAECLWGYFGWECSNVRHLRLGFYTGDIFTEEPTMDRDVPPILAELRRARPNVVSVALDPEASGPDTHYKVMQAISQALKQYEAESGCSDITVLGYRNVWYRFHPAEASLYVPITLNMFSIMQSAFADTFASQKDASFPSYEHDGPFSELAQKIQVEQYQTLKTCLGRQWFHEHPSALIRATRGFVFLREMPLAEFYQRSRELKHAAEDR